MKRKNLLFSLADKLKNIKVILIYIDEAHSNKWKIGLNNHPDPQKDFEDRIKRAKKFILDFDPTYELYVDLWNNNYANAFHAWPDKYYLIDKDKKVLQKSEYGTKGDKDGKVIVDCTKVLQDYCSI